jgi:hypothetical protein
MLGASWRTKMKNLLLLVLVLLFANGAYAQGADPSPSQTSAPATSRFEIIQSPLAAKWTFLLDKYTGRVQQLVKTKDDGTAWESMKMIELPKAPLEPKVRYQIFTSGLAARHTFLLNVETGQSWILSTFKDDKLGDVTGWSPFDN